VKHFSNHARNLMVEVVLICLSQGGENLAYQELSLKLAFVLYVTKHCGPHTLATGRREFSMSGA